MITLNKGLGLNFLDKSLRFLTGFVYKLLKISLKGPLAGPAGPGSLIVSKGPPRDSQVVVRGPGPPGCWLGAPGLPGR